MIGKGRFFDLITRTADDLNNPEITIGEAIRNFHAREEKYKEQISINSNAYREER